MLTDAQARKALPGERDYKLTDEKGLFLLVRPGGGKLWRYKYRFAGREKLLSFGPYHCRICRDCRGGLRVTQFRASPRSTAGTALRGRR